MAFIQMLTNGFTQTIDWAKMVNSQNVDVVTSQTTLSGDLVVVGTFTGTVDFDPGSSTYNLSSSGTSSNIFIAKYKNSGSFSFAKQIGNMFTETLYDMAIDGSNYIVISGKISGVVDMNPGIATNSIGSSGTTTAFIARYSSTGTFSWAKTFNGNINFTSLAAGNSNKIITTGHYQGTRDFNPGSSVNNLTSASGSTDVFVATYSSSGNYTWAESIGNASSTERSFDVRVDETYGYIFVVGIFKGTMNFSTSSSASYNFTSNAGNSDMYVWKLNEWGGTMQVRTAVVLELLSQNKFVSLMEMYMSADFLLRLLILRQLLLLQQITLKKFL